MLETMECREAQSEFTVSWSRTRTYSTRASAFSAFPTDKPTFLPSWLNSRPFTCSCTFPSPNSPQLMACVSACSLLQHSDPIGAIFFNAYIKSSHAVQYLRKIRPFHTSRLDKCRRLEYLAILVLFWVCLSDVSLSLTLLLASYKLWPVRTNK